MIQLIKYLNIFVSKYLVNSCVKNWGVALHHYTSFLFLFCPLTVIASLLWIILCIFYMCSLYNIWSSFEEKTGLVGWSYYGTISLRWHSNIYSNHTISIFQMLIWYLVILWLIPKAVFDTQTTSKLLCSTSMYVTLIIGFIIYIVLNTEFTESDPVYT